MAGAGRGTRTSQFGTTRREGHDSSAFYERFAPPEISDDTEVVRTAAQLEKLGAGACFHGSSADMSEISDSSVALVVTSPPYFVGKEYELAVTGETDPMNRIPTSYMEYLDMLREVFAECQRVLEPGGRIAVNVANLGRKPYRSLSADIITILQDDLGLLLRGEIIWQKSAASAGSCAWGSFAKASNPVLRDVTERVIVASKGRFSRALTASQRRQRELPHESSISNDEFVDVTRDVWTIDAESASRVGHPAPFPVELPRRLIDLYTYVDDIVLDPFLGSGTTVVAAARTGRIGVGYDLDAEYVDMARGRLDTELERVARVDAADEKADLVAELKPEDRQEFFQRQAVGEGRKFHDIASALLADVGFEVKGGAKIPEAGIEFDFLVTDGAGAEWFVDLAGAFVTSRPGLTRTDEVWRLLARLHILRCQRPAARALVLTSNVAKRNSPGDKALRSIGSDVLFDVVELFDPQGQARLAAYAVGGASEPISGFWPAG